MKYRIKSDYPLKSDWLPAKAFKQHYDCQSTAIAIAIEGVDDPEDQEVQVVCVETGEVVWRSIDEKYECRCVSDEFLQETNRRKNHKRGIRC